MKKFTGLVILVIATCFELQAQHAEGNPFARLGYKADVYTFGEKKEFHDQEEIVEIGEVLFNTKTNEVVGFVDDTDSLIELKPELQSMSIDPHCEKYYSISPYAYCMNNPVKYIDPDGKDVAILIAKNGAGGRGHMGAVIQDERGNYYYMTLGGDVEGSSGTLSAISSGTEGKMSLIQLDFKDNEPSMKNAIDIIRKRDTYNSPYTDNLIFETSPKMDNDILTSAAILKVGFNEKNIKYNPITNNCADAVRIVIEKGTGIVLPVGNSPKPNNQFENIKKNKEKIQNEINNIIEDENEEK